MLVIGRRAIWHQVSAQLQFSRCAHIPCNAFTTLWLPISRLCKHPMQHWPCRENDTASYTGLMKVDMTAAAGHGACGHINFPANCAGVEMSFVARDPDAMRDGRCQDDDGYLVGYVTDQASQMSYLMVYDAMTMNSNPVAAVEMPRRIPLGFHGLYVHDHELQMEEP
jgi:Retinal pigment epithelial membrane protein